MSYGLAAFYSKPSGWFCNNYPQWLMTTDEFSSCMQIPGPVPVPAPTQSQLDAVAASDDPGSAAVDLTQALSNSSVLMSQQQLQQFVNSLPAGSSFPGLDWSIPTWVWIAAGGLGVVLLLRAVK